MTFIKENHEHTSDGNNKPFGDSGVEANIIALELFLRNHVALNGFERKVNKEKITGIT